jgi:hypothetical protein
MNAVNNYISDLKGIFNLEFSLKITKRCQLPGALNV